MKPCQGQVALLMLDNIGHGEDASKRPMGVAGKGHKVDVKLSSKRREDPLALVITAEKARPIRAPFRKGTKWIAYESGCRGAVVFDARQIEIETEDRARSRERAVVLAALRKESPLGLNKLEDALRDAGLKGRSQELRDRIKAMAVDPNGRVRDTGHGFKFVPESGSDLPMSRPMSQAHVHVPLKTWDMDGQDDHDEAPDAEGR